MLLGVIWNGWRMRQVLFHQENLELLARACWTRTALTQVGGGGLWGHRDRSDNWKVYIYRVCRLGRSPVLHVLLGWGWMCVESSECILCLSMFALLIIVCPPTFRGWMYGSHCSTPYRRIGSIS